MIADEHLLVTFNKHYKIPIFVSQVEAHGIQIMVSMTKMDCVNAQLLNISVMIKHAIFIMTCYELCAVIMI